MVSPRNMDADEGDEQSENSSPNVGEEERSTKRESAWTGGEETQRTTHV